MSEEVEKVGKEIFELHFPHSNWESLPSDTKEAYFITAKWHIREKEKACLEEMIIEMICSKLEDYPFNERFNEYCFKLAQLSQQKEKM